MSEISIEAPRPEATPVSTNNEVLARLLNKPKNRSTLTLYLADGTLDITFEAISMQAYDKLVAAHPPKADQAAEGSNYNVDTFGPALISACAVEPTFTVKEATDLWNSPNWSRGDVQAIFAKAVNTNFQGATVPLSERG